MKCKVFKIALQDDEFDESKINELLANVEVKQVFASVVNDIENFWSVMVFYNGTAANPKSSQTASSQLNRGVTPHLTGKSYSIPVSAAIEPKPPVVEPESLSPAQEKSFEALRAWRDERARLEGLPAYVVAHDELLIQIVSASIRSSEDLLKIIDFGHKRTEIYGDEIVNILSANA